MMKYFLLYFQLLKKDSLKREVKFLGEEIEEVKEKKVRYHRHHASKELRYKLAPDGSFMTTREVL